MCYGEKKCTFGILLSESTNKPWRVITSSCNLVFWKKKYFLKFYSWYSVPKIKIHLSKPLNNLSINEKSDEISIGKINHFIKNIIFLGLVFLFFSFFSVFLFLLCAKGGDICRQSCVDIDWIKISKPSQLSALWSWFFIGFSWFICYARIHILVCDLIAIVRISVRQKESDTI